MAPTLWQQIFSTGLIRARSAADFSGVERTASTQMSMKRGGKGDSLAVQGVMLRAHTSGTIGASMPPVVAGLKHSDSTRSRRRGRVSG